MDGQLVSLCPPPDSAPEWILLVKQWRQEVTELRAEVRRLQRDNLELRQQVGYWKSRHRDALGRVTALEQKVEQLEGEKRQLQADLLGRRSESRPLNDRSDYLDDPQDGTPPPRRNRGQQPKNPGPKRRDYSRLPAHEESRELPPERCVCPRCGQPLLPRGDTEDSEQIEIDVRAYRRVIHRRRYRRTCTCEGPRTLTAPAPPKLIPKGVTGSRYGSRSSWTSISPIVPPNACWPRGRCWVWTWHRAP
jgi:hypothetical protein